MTYNSPAHGRSLTRFYPNPNCWSENNKRYTKQYEYMSINAIYTSILTEDKWLF